MRNFRKAALAGATAVAVAFGSTAVATAATEGTEAPATPVANVSVNPDNGKGDKTAGDSGLSSKAGNKLEGDKTAYGPALFGSTKGEGAGEAETYNQQPVWAKVFQALSIFTAVSALVGLIVGPAYNFVVHGPFHV